MIRKKSFGEILFDSSNIGFMVLLSIVSLYPLLYVLFASLSDPLAVSSTRGILLYPQGLTWDAYELVFQNPNIKVSYFNTIIYVIVGTLINILMTALGAYALSRQNVMWGNTIMFMIVFTMFFSGGLIPTYILISDLGMMNTRWALLLPGAISAFNLIIMRTAFQAVPIDLEESARMDGAKDWTILFRVVLPLSMPVVAVMVLFYGVGHWNSWFPAMIFLQDRELFPIQLILREILIANNTDSMMMNVTAGDQMPIGETIKYATIIVSTLPILCLYPFLQKYFVKGVMIGAIKG
jgi:putative aldouronate transport system permease protein